MAKHLSYIDELKGFAIFLVVLGHVLSFSFGAFGSDYQSPILTFIYGFHMPLFAFLSGLVIKGITSFASLLKRITRLLIPMFTIGILYSLWRDFSIYEFAFSDAKFGYWYLLFLFISYVLITLYEWMMIRVSRNSRIEKDVIASIVFCGIIYYGGRYVPNNSIFCWQISSHLYPYIFLGYLVTKYHLFDKLFDNAYIYESCIVIAACSFVGMYFLHHGSLLYSFRPAMVFFMVSLFYRYRNNNCYAKGCLRKMGGASLPIYIFHYFFVHSSYIPYLSHYALTTGAVFIEALFGIVFTIVICYLCVLLDKLIKTSKLMRFFCYGDY